MTNRYAACYFGFWTVILVGLFVYVDYTRTSVARIIIMILVWSLSCVCAVGFGKAMGRWLDGRGSRCFHWLGR